jgi:hypothetical protein
MYSRFVSCHAFTLNISALRANMPADYQGHPEDRSRKVGYQSRF